MQLLPKSEEALVIRTDFSDVEVWKRLWGEILAPVGRFKFRAYVNFVDDLAYENLSTDKLLALVPEGFDHNFIMVADQTTFTHPEHPLLVVDLYDQPGRSFRAPPDQVQGIENNLSISNMDFYEFADNVDADGIFRGFGLL
jgi:hypothetical protein